MSIKKMISYRDIWMGIAMLWVMIFHSGINFYYGPLNFIKGIGYGGVDIFIFASGVGNYYSYLKDNAPLSFMKRRLVRLLTSYIPFIIIWCIVEIARCNLSIPGAIGNLLLIQGFSSSDISFNWYLSLIILCYILTPYLATFVKNHSFKHNVLLIGILLLVTISFWKDPKFIVSITRLPIYVIGMLAAKYCDKQIQAQHFILSTLFGIAGIVILYLLNKYFEYLLWDYGLAWYPFILIVPFFCCIVSLAADKINNGKTVTAKILSAIKMLGKYSFELYLLHIFIFDIVRKYIPAASISVQNLYWVILLIISFIAAWLLKRLSEKIQGIIK